MLERLIENDEPYFDENNPIEDDYYKKIWYNVNIATKY